MKKCLKIFSVNLQAGKIRKSSLEGVFNYFDKYDSCSVFKEKIDSG